MTIDHTTKVHIARRLAWAAKQLTNPDILREAARLAKRDAHSDRLIVSWEWWVIDIVRDELAYQEYLAEETHARCLTGECEQHCTCVKYGDF